MQHKIYETVKLYYHYPLSRLRKANPDAYTIVKYEALTARTCQTVELVYRQLGYFVTAAFHEILQEEDALAKKYASKHLYSLAQFQITQGQIVAELSDVFERFGYRTTNAIGQD
jgi:hypothetical protein